MRIEQQQWSAQTGWSARGKVRALGESAQVAFIFGAANLLKQSEAFERCAQAYPNAHLLGCSTAGEILGTNMRRDTVAITAVAFSNARVAVARVDLPNPEGSFEAGAKLVRALDPAGLRHIFVISEVVQVDASQVMSGINSALPPGVTVSGGFSADGDRQQISHIWCNGGPAQSSAAALGFYGDRLKIGMAVTGLWGQFGPVRKITKSKGSVLYELDGHSALSLYKQYLGELASKLPASGLLFPISLSIRNTRHSVLRGLLSVDEGSQSMRFAGDVPEGAQVRMMMGTIERLIDDSYDASRLSTAGLEGVAPELAFIVSCNGRRVVLGQRVEEELEAVGEVLGEGTVLAGFYSCGEIAPIAPGETAELHNESLAITTFAEV
jgi:hypothetical protein